MARLLAAATTMVALTALSACAGLETTGTADEPARGSDALPQDEPTLAEPASDESVVDVGEDDMPTPPEVVGFGETWTYEDGLELTVGEPKPFTPSEWAITGTEQRNVSFTVTILNSTAGVFDPSGFRATVQSGNRQAEEVNDSENDVGSSPSTKVLPGRETRFRVAFNVAKPADLVMEVSAGWDYDSALYATGL